MEDALVSVGSSKIGHIGLDTLIFEFIDKKMWVAQGDGEIYTTSRVYGIGVEYSL